MNTMPQTTDSVTPRHEELIRTGLLMAQASLDGWYGLTRDDRRELLRCWTAFMADLHALGITPPTRPSPTPVRAAVPAPRKSL